MSFSGGPSTDGNMNLGGFNLWASDGTFSTVDDSTQLWGPAEASHTESGNDQRSWTVDWTAPESGANVDFILHVNSVNGNEGNGGSSGDMWNRADVTVLGFGDAPLPEVDPFKVLATLVVISGVMLSIVVMYIFYRKNPDNFDWENFSPWISEWLTSTDHKKIGTLYFVQGLFFLGVGGIMALMIRMQLAVPGNDFISQDYYNQFFTLHGLSLIHI